MCDPSDLRCRNQPLSASRSQQHPVALGTRAVGAHAGAVGQWLSLQWGDLSAPRLWRARPGTIEKQRAAQAVLPALRWQLPDVHLSGSRPSQRGAHAGASDQLHLHRPAHCRSRPAGLSAGDDAADPFRYPAKELAVLYHERWQVELVIDESRTHLRLSARTLRSLTANGVIQELYALLLAHTLVRTLMLRAAQPQGLAPTTISFTDTIRLVDDSLVPLSLVSSARRQQMVGSLLQELGTFRLPKQQVRIQARVVKRVRSRYERKKPEHWQAPPLEWDLDFHQILALVV